MTSKVLLFAVTLVVLYIPSTIKGQSLNKMRYSAAGYTLIEGAILSPDDTTNLDIFDNGFFVTDLGFHIDPSRSSSISVVLRASNDYRLNLDIFGSLQFRQMILKGVIGRSFFYTLGDFDYQMTPLTLYTMDEEGMFGAGIWGRSMQKLNNYNNFYFGNQRRLRGLHSKYAFNMKRVNFLEKLEVEGFVSKSRASAFATDTTPDLLLGGGKIAITQNKNLTVNINSVNTFSLQRRDDDFLINNNIYGADAQYKYLTGIWQFGVSGELAISNMSYGNDESAPDSRSDYAMDLGFNMQTSKKTFNLDLNYMNTGWQYYNIASQSKSIDFSRRPELFSTVGNEPVGRNISLLDLSRDFSIYDPSIRESLMEYNPRYANTLPYGLSTPNRTGFRLAVTAKDYLEKVTLRANAYALQEVNSLMFANKKKFLLTNISGTVKLNNFLQWSKILQIDVGAQMENTNRADFANSFGASQGVDLKTTTLTVGLDIEPLQRIHLIGSSVFISSTGNERIPTLDEFNNPNPVVNNQSIDDSQWLISGGIEYRLNDNMYVILNYNRLNIVDKILINNNTYSIDHISALVNLNI